MAKYKGRPHYSVRISDNKKIRFDHNGFYETSDAGEVEVLNALCPRYFSCVDEGKKEPKPEEKPKPKAPARKSSAK